MRCPRRGLVVTTHDQDRPLKNPSRTQMNPGSQAPAPAASAATPAMAPLSCALSSLRVGGLGVGLASAPACAAPAAPPESELPAWLASAERALRMRRNALGLWLLKKFCRRSCARAAPLLQATGCKGHVRELVPEAAEKVLRAVLRAHGDIRSGFIRWASTRRRRGAARLGDVVLQAEGVLLLARQPRQRPRAALAQRLQRRALHVAEAQPLGRARLVARRVRGPAGAHSSEVDINTLKYWQAQAVCGITNHEYSSWLQAGSC